MARIARATGWEALGLIPFLPDARLLPAEDAWRSMPLQPARRMRASGWRCRFCAYRHFDDSIRLRPNLRSICYACVQAQRCRGTAIW